MYNVGPFYTPTLSGTTDLPCVYHTPSSINDPLLINIDWLEIKYVGPFTDIDQDFRSHRPQAFYQLTQDIRLEKNSNHRPGTFPAYTVLIKGEVLGDLSLPDPKYKSLKIDNKRLYTPDWYTAWQLFEYQTNLLFNNITRLDLAIDGIGLFEKFNEFYCRRKYTIKRNIKPRGDYDNITNRFSGSIHIGSPKSPLYLALYEKGKMVHKENKPYITEYWKTNGLASTDQVSRIELRLRNKAIKRYSLTLDKLADTNYLLELFKTHGLDHLTFTDSQEENTNVSRKTKHSLIDLAQVVSSPVKIKIKRPVSDSSSLYSDKITLRNLDSKLSYTGNVIFQNAIHEILELSPELAVWYEMRRSTNKETSKGAPVFQ